MYMKKTLVLMTVALAPSGGHAEPATELSLKGGLDSAALSKSYRISRYGPTLFLEVRHQRGLIDVDTMDLGLKNRTTSFLVGLSVVLGSEAIAQPGTTGGKS